MLRRVLFASALTLLAVSPAPADTIGYQASVSPYGLQYSPSASPFEAFEWTPLEFAAFRAYGGDFANIRKPVTPIYFLELPSAPGLPNGPDDELVMRSSEPLPFLENIPYYEPRAQASMLYVSDLPLADEASPSSIPEPGLLALIGVGMIGLSNRLRRRYQSQR
jgi:hypothetical protein